MNKDSTVILVTVHLADLCKSYGDCFHQFKKLLETNHKREKEKSDKSTLQSLSVNKHIVMHFNYMRNNIR